MCDKIHGWQLGRLEQSCYLTTEFLRDGDLRVTTFAGPAGILVLAETRPPTWENMGAGDMWLHATWDDLAAHGPVASRDDGLLADGLREALRHFLQEADHV